MSYTVSQIAKMTKKPRITISRAIERKELIADKLDPTAKTSAYVISEAALQAYINKPKSRCEPCDHEKKRCTKCKKMICLNDYHMLNSMLNRRRPTCKDCDNKAKQAHRAKQATKR